ncbi:nitrate/nitrite transporter [Dongia sp.]|uniref:MFS transporter n=1 Tax=Dongia sp. TaxID=1977262 RepID=UPI0035AF6C20
MTQLTRSTILRALGPFAAGYFTSYLFRVVNAAISDDLIAELDLSNTDLGLMTSMYLYGFVLFQLPLGLLLDRFGPRLVQAWLLLIAAIGAGLFAMGTDTASLAVARLLIGTGLSGCLMAAFKANAMWLPPERLALGNSAVVTFGGLGFLSGTYPANLAADLIGWRGVFWILVVFTLCIAAAIFVLVPKRDDDHHPVALSTQVSGYLGIFKDSVFWRVSPMVAAISGTFIAVQTLWATRWMNDVAGLDRHAAGQQLMILGFAFAVGSLSTGLIADAAQRRGIGLKTIVAAAFSLYAAAQLAMIFAVPLPLAAIWAVYGFTGQAANLGYATLGAHFGRRLAGRAQSAANLLLFLASALFQSTIGWTLDHLVTTQAIAKADAYAIALGSLLVLQILAFAWYATGRYANPR